MHGLWILWILNSKIHNPQVYIFILLVHPLELTEARVVIVYIVSALDIVIINNVMSELYYMIKVCFSYLIIM